MSRADEIWTGGRVLTMDPARPRAEALAVADGRLIAVGTAAEVANLSGPGTRVRNLRGRFVMPGLVESHTHALWGACRTLFDVYVGFGATLDQLLAAVKARAGATPPGEVVYGGPWLPAMRAEMGARPADLLDAISNAHPIVLHDASQHLLWCNTMALTRAGLGPDAPDIPGGVIERDPATGAPDGVVAETATAPVRALIQRTEAQMADALREAVRYFNAYGFTAFKEPMAFEADLAAYRAGDARGDLTLHMAAHIVHSSPLGGGEVTPFDEMDRLRAPLRQRECPARLRQTFPRRGGARFHCVLHRALSRGKRL